MATLSEDGSIIGESASRDILTRHIKHWDDHDFGVWLFDRSIDREPIGYCGLRTCASLDPPEIELFFGVRSQYFKNGFGTEMARTVLSLGFNDLNVKSVVGFTLENNSGSRALMAKIGMSYVGVVDHTGIPHCLYRIVHSND